MKSGWFGPKPFGGGPRPTGWQGWLVTVLFFIAMIGTARIVDDLRLWVQCALILLLLGVVWLTYREPDPPEPTDPS